MVAITGLLNPEARKKYEGAQAVVLELPESDASDDEKLFRVELMNARPSQDKEFNLLRKNLDLLEARSEVHWAKAGQSPDAGGEGAGAAKPNLNVVPSPAGSPREREPDASGSHAGHHLEVPGAGADGAASVDDDARSDSLSGSHSREHSPGSGPGGSHSGSYSGSGGSHEIGAMDKLAAEHGNAMDSDFAHAHGT